MINKAIDKEEKIKLVTALYNEIEIKDFTKSNINNLMEESLKLLDKISVQKKTSLIKNLIIKLLDRNN